MKRSFPPQQLANRPTVSCILPTYNRVRQDQLTGRYSCELVEEAVESFLRQTYRHSELIILNDTPDQNLYYDPPDPRVRIYNFSTRFKTLGDKCNYGISLARGSYVTRWDDDDISFPTRLESCVKLLQNGRIKVLQVGGYWWMDQGKYEACEGLYGFQQDLYATEVAAKTGYMSKSNGEDQDMRRDCIAAVGHHEYVKYLPTPAMAHYIYRWSDTGAVHLSCSDPDPEKKYQQIGKMPVCRVNYKLNPHWNTDYIEAIKCLLHPSPS